jgi:ABC-type transport system substrate-binding protein
MLHQAETILADEVFSVPLFARPQHLLYSNKVKGALRNPTQQGITWNVEAWSVAS